MAWLAGRIGPADDPTRLVAADLYLVAACLLDVPGAVRAFVEGPLAATERKVGGIVKSPEARGELLQEMTVALLAPGPDGGPPKLAQYAGRGALAVWLRMTATRRALNTERGKTRSVSFEEVAFDKVADANPELSVLRRRHKGEIAAIFREATAATPREDRVLLRLHYVQGSTLNELAAIFRTSRSSIHRRIDLARDELMTRIAGLVRGRMQLETHDQASMLRIFQSDLRESLRDLLKDEPSGNG
ncbi:MAG: hypothetical protein KC635_22210 [Myxococcales bacterium]|nr:hypothetical protein [Myxococcales bacterium]